MVIMILEKVPQALKGELTRWLMEVKPGVYIGHINAMVRDRLWDKCDKARKAGVVFQAWSTNNEQHFKMRISGSQDRTILDWEGMQVVQELGEELSAVQKRRVKQKE